LGLNTTAVESGKCLAGGKSLGKHHHPVWKTPFTVFYQVSQDFKPGFFNIFYDRPERNWDLTASSGQTAIRRGPFETKPTSPRRPPRQGGPGNLGTHQYYGPGHTDWKVLLTSRFFPLRTEKSPYASGRTSSISSTTPTFANPIAIQSHGNSANPPQPWGSAYGPPQVGTTGPGVVGGGPRVIRVSCRCGVPGFGTGASSRSTAITFIFARGVSSLRLPSLAVKQSPA